MEALRCVLLLGFACFVYQAHGCKTYGDMFPHKHEIAGKIPYPIPPIPGWGPGTKPLKQEVAGKIPFPIPPVPGWDPSKIPYPIPPIPGWGPGTKPSKQEVAGKIPFPIPPVPGWDPADIPYPIPPIPGWGPDTKPSKEVTGKIPFPIPPVPGWDPSKIPYPIPPIPGWGPGTKPSKQDVAGKIPFPIPPVPGWDPADIPYPIPPIPGWGPDTKPSKEVTGKIPFPIPPIPGWDPDTNPWDDYLYPPLNPKPNQFMHHKGKPKVRLTSDSPALNGSSVTFTAKLEYPPCQKEDANGDLVWDDHCEDANGQLRSGYVYNWTSWMDDYGFGKCTDLKRCNVFPDGRPFPQSNDWKRKSYVYVWHTMGQYSETCDGSSSSLTINTSSIPLGAEVMEVLVYRKRERRKYSPLSTDNTVFYVTEKIPVAVDISQKAAVNQSDRVFFRGEEMLFKVRVHDPSGYLKTAASVDYIWDFRDGNQLVTHRELTTHTYSRLGTMSVKLVVEAAFPAECPPTPAPSTQRSSTSPPPTEVPPPGTHAATVKMETTQVPSRTSRPPLPSTSTVVMTSGVPTTEPLGPTAASATPDSTPTDLAWLHSKRVSKNACFRYAHGTFVGNITIIEPKHAMNSQPNSRIVDVSASRVTKTDISFLVTCLGNIPTSACTVVSDPSCNEVHSIMCDDVPPTATCEVRIRRTFLEPGTYCVNITLEDASSLALTTTTVTIDKSQETPVSKKSHAAEVVLSSSAVLVAVFAFIAYLACRRYKVYRPIRRTMVEDACGHAGVGGRMVRLRDALFPSNEESHHLLTERRPL